MGEQVATKEEANNKEESPAPAAAPEAAPAPAPAEEKKDQAAPPPADQDPNKDEAAPPPPPVPVILGVEVHCTGCAKRIRRSLLRCKGVEVVHVDMPANQVTIKGAVDPQALCARLRAKTKREATLISPLPPPPPPEGEEPPPPPPPPAPPLVSEARTVELLVNMHCEACAQQLQSKMMKMKGVVSAETNLAAGKLTLSATVEDEKIVEYIHRRTGKIASVVPPPPPEPPKEEEPPAPAADAEPPKEEAPADADGKKEEAGENKPAEDGKAAAEGEEKKEGGGGAGEEDQKPGKQEGVAVDGFPPEEMMKRMVYWPYGGAPGGGVHYKLHPADAEEAMMARRMAMHAMPPPMPPPPHHHHHNPYAMMHQQWAPPPPPPPPGMPMYNNYNYGSSYMMERPPQMFSDENPNACVIS